MNRQEAAILIAEDDPNDVFLIQRAFQRMKLSHPVNVVRDGQEALAYLEGDGVFADRERHPLPTLLLLDLKMPRRSGFEVLAWVRQQPVLRRMAVVVLTSSNQTSDVNHAYDLGANSYLVKPAGFDNLVELVKSLERYWLVLNEKPEVQNGRGGPEALSN